MENNTFFDAWLETQKQLMNNWTDSNRKLQEAVKSGSAVKDGMSIYQEWLSKQAEITKSATEQAGKTFQSQLANGAEAFQNGKSAANLSDIYNNWMSAQKDLTEKAFNNFKTFTQPFTQNNAFANDSMNQFQNFQQQWWNNFQNWSGQSQQSAQQWFAPFQSWNKGFTDDTVKDAWNNMTNMSNAYVKFYEMWSPMYKNMLNNSFNAEWMKSSFNTEAFRDLMDRTIAFAAPAQTKEFFQQFQNWMEVTNNYNRHLYQQFVGNVPENLKNLTPFLLFGNDANNTANNVFAAYQRSVSPLMRLFYPGKESEMNELQAGIMDKLSVYGQKLAELQQQMYVTGAKTWEAFLFENADQLKKGGDLSNMQQVFQAWVAKNEEAFINLFRSDAYSKTQGELLDLSLEIKQRSEKIGEMVLQPLPVVLRSEADELYTTIYELRKRVHALEKQLGETSEEPAKEAKTSKKKTATA